MRVSFPRLFFLLGLVVLPLGCGSGEHQVPVYPVRGAVLLNGRPIPHALVVLHPLKKPDKEVPQPRATAGNDGSFVLATYSSADGAPAGEYAVTVEWWQSSGKSDAAPTNRLPQRYAKAETSGLRVRIEAGENELPAIKLTR